jgi:hypothetical protein
VTESSPEILAELEELAARAKAADAEVTGLVDRVTAEQRQRFPEPERSMERMEWPAAESAELARLRGVALEAWGPVWELRKQHGLGWK